MSINQWVYRVADGQLCLNNGPDPIVYLSDSKNYALIDLGEGAEIPDERLQRVDVVTNTLRPATITEIAAFDNTQAKIVPTRDIINRLTADEVIGLFKLSMSDANVCKLWHILITSSQTDIHSQEWRDGIAYVVSVAIPSIWPDTNTANSRIATIEA